MPNPATTKDLPDKAQVARFISRLKQNKWNLKDTLAEEGAGRQGRRWCQTCTTFVAVYAVLTGQEEAFSVQRSTGKHTHAAGSLYNQIFDFAHDQYGPSTYARVREHMRPWPGGRKSYLGTAQQEAGGASKNVTTPTLRALLGAGYHQEAKRINELLPVLTP